MEIHSAAKQIKSLTPRLGALDTESKNKALEAIAQALENRRSEAEAVNQKDLDNATREGVAAPLVARLKFQGAKIDLTIQGLRSLIRLENPVGRIRSARELDEGLILQQVSSPIGVIGMIFESRPDALVQIASLALKSGNGLVLKGGSEARLTNRFLADLIAKATEEAGIPGGWIFLVETRDEIAELLKMHHEIDLLIPRGSNEFVQYIMDNTRIPVLGHADGITHLYVHSAADVPMAVGLAVDSKTQYISVCNALETLLVDKAVAGDFLPQLKKAMDEKSVELRGCQETQKIIPVKEATEIDWKTEYLDLILSVKVVDGLSEAVAHINLYGSGHTDSVVTGDPGVAEDFMNLVDSGCVFWNTSTRFSDGFVFGLGAEVE